MNLWYTLKKLPLSESPFCMNSWGILTQFCNPNSYRTGGMSVVGVYSLPRPQKHELEFQTQSSCVCEPSLLALFFQVHIPSVTMPAKLMFCWLLSVLRVASCLSYHPLLTAHCGGLQTDHLPTTLASGQTFLYTAARRTWERSHFLLRILQNYYCFYTMGQHLQPNWIPPEWPLPTSQHPLLSLPNEYPGPPTAQPSFLFLIFLLTLLPSAISQGSVLGFCVGEFCYVFPS